MSLSKTILMAHALLLSDGVVMIRSSTTEAGDVIQTVVELKDMYSDYGRTTRDNGDSRRVTINEVSTRSGLSGLAAALACCAPDPVVWADPPPVDTWYVKPVKKLQSASQQPFRSRMRSVNRNR